MIRLSVLLVLALGLGCYEAPEFDAGPRPVGTDAAVGGPGCVDEVRHLARELWGPILVTCRGCHNNFGLAVEEGSWQLRWDADPESLAANVATLKTYGSFLLEMAADQVEGRPHPGGRLIEPGTPTYAAFERLLAGGFDSCEGAPADGLFEGLQPLPPWRLLHKAQQVLTGQRPDLTTVEAFEASGSDLDAALDRLMDGPEFLDWIKASYKDLLLTDGPLGINGNSIVYTSHLRKEQYPNRFYFYDVGHPGGFRCCRSSSPRGCDPASRGCCFEDESVSAEFCAEGDARIASDLAREPLELVAHVVENRRPFTEILTADYTLVNPFTAQVYDVALHNPELVFEDPMDGDDWRPVRLQSQQSFGASYPAPNPVPHAGLVSSHAFMNRYRTNGTNLNRARTQTIFERFMGVELGQLLEFTVTTQDDLPHNPTMDARTCRTCHAAMDPVAGAMRHWDHVGRIHHGIFWNICGFQEDHPRYDDRLCVRRTSWKGEYLDEANQAEVDNALGWMMERLARDRRFAHRTVQTLLESLTGIAGIRVPQDRLADDYEAHLLAYLRQQQDLATWADALMDNGYQIRPIIKSIIRSPWFNGGSWGGTNSAQSEALAFAQIGGRKLITPERLHERLLEITGFPWRMEANVNRHDWLLKGTTFRVLYGGIDGDSVVKRSREPFPVMAAVARRMANEMSCLAVAQDFAFNDRANRRLFPYVDVTMEPELPAEPDQDTAFRQNLQHLHYRILGERLALNDPEIDASYNLLNGVWTRGLEGSAEPLHERCRASRDFFERGRFGDDRSAIESDDRFVLRSWMALLTYLLSDAEFLME